MQSESVQILHDNNHWVTSGVVGGDVVLSDCINRQIRPGLSRQLKQLQATALTTAGNRRVHVLPCEKQTTGSACGVLAAAYAFELAMRSASVEFLYGPEAKNARAP